jgi:ELWxxDGT repeat protein
LIFTIPEEWPRAETYTGDGTAQGTRFLLDSTEADSFSFITRVGDPQLNGDLYFAGKEGIEDFHYLLWRTDGTAEGTTPVKDINPEGFGFGGFAPGRYLVWEEELYFATNVEGLGTELWKTDGTEAGTLPVADINPFGDFGSSFPSGLTLVNNELFFSADDGTSGQELWKTDGTTEGTQLVKDIFPGGADNDGIPDPFLTEFKGKLYFNGTDGTSGRELWVSDGTEEGTRLLKDLVPGSAGGNPRYFAVLDSSLYFYSGNDIWKTDGTEEGTVPSVDISVRSEFVKAGNDLFFMAVDSENGFELWRTDGTETGTFLVKDLFPGGSSIPELLGYVNEVLYFTAVDPEFGRELYSLSPVRIETRLSAEKEAICGVADSITFTAEVSNAGDNPIFSWYVDGQIMLGETGPEFTAGGLSDGARVNYRVLTSDKSVWRLESIVSSDTLTVGISGLAPQLSVLGDQLAASPAASYRWFLDGTPR